MAMIGVNNPGYRPEKKPLGEGSGLFDRIYQSLDIANKILGTGIQGYRAFVTEPQELGTRKEANKIAEGSKRTDQELARAKILEVAEPIGSKKPMPATPLQVPGAQVTPMTIPGAERAQNPELQALTQVTPGQAPTEKRFPWQVMPEAAQGQKAEAPKKEYDLKEGENPIYFPSVFGDQPFRAKPNAGKSLTEWEARHMDVLAQAAKGDPYVVRLDKDIPIITIKSVAEKMPDYDPEKYKMIESGAQFTNLGSAARMALSDQMLASMLGQRQFSQDVERTKLSRDQQDRIAKQKIDFVSDWEKRASKDIADFSAAKAALKNFDHNDPVSVGATMQFYVKSVLKEGGPLTRDDLSRTFPALGQSDLNKLSNYVQSLIGGNEDTTQLAGISKQAGDYLRKQFDKSLKSQASSLTNKWRSQAARAKNVYSEAWKAGEIQSVVNSEYEALQDALGEYALQEKQQSKDGINVNITNAPRGGAGGQSRAQTQSAPPPMTEDRAQKVQRARDALMRLKGIQK